MTNSALNGLLTSIVSQAAVKEVVRTANINEAIERVGQAYNARKPVLLQGQIGSGKHFTCILGAHSGFYNF